MNIKIINEYKIYNIIIQFIILRADIFNITRFGSVRHGRSHLSYCHKK